MISRRNCKSDWRAATRSAHISSRDEPNPRSPAIITHPRAGALLSLYQRLHGLPRHLGQHSGGTRARCPALEEWVRRHLGRVVETSADWTRVLNVCNYFLVHPRPGLYARQLPIAVPTKFIDDRRKLLRPILDFLLGSRVQAEARTFNERFGLLEDEPHVRLQFLDDALRVASGHPVPDATLPVGAMRGLALHPAVTVVVENKMCFLTLPPLPNAVARLGSGKAAALLHNVDWLRQSRLIYWGDMDDTGFNILSRLREEYPQTESLLMDVAAWQAHSRLAHPGNLDFHTPERLFLTLDEKATWRLVREGGHLIEQEQIPLEANAPWIGSTVFAACACATNAAPTSTKRS